eukprot:COSAG02_NODE_162_length_32474_cov_13.222511_13_plen_384_part_00
MMLRGVLFSAVLAGVATATTTRWHELESYSFEDYEREFDRHYESEAERDQRRQIVEQNLRDARLHNADPGQTWKRGVNHFTDRTENELAVMKGLDRELLFRPGTESAAHPVPQHLLDDSIRMGDLPTSVDWREKGVVTPVKNQGGCGSCWTFASTETLESHYAIKHQGMLEELSEQFVLDCTPNPHECGGTGGCAGGTAELAYGRLSELSGIPSEWTYPYISGTGKAGQCHGLPLPPQRPHTGVVMNAANVTGHVSLPNNEYEPMMKAVATLGPLAISVDAGAWHSYESGVFSGGNHTDPELDHLVQLVGYGSDAGVDYWLVRNSWTTLWGEAGYIKLARSSTPTCGTDTAPLDGNGCKGGPPTVRVCGQSGVLYDGVYPLVK